MPFIRRLDRAALGLLLAAGFAFAGRGPLYAMEPGSAPPDTANASVLDSTPPPFRIELMGDLGGSFDDLDREIPDDDERWFLAPDDDEHLEHDREMRLTVASMLRYNRVEGLAASLGFERELKRDTMLPAYRARIAYAFAAQRGLYTIFIEQPLVPRHKLTLGASAYRKNDVFFYGDEIISGGENSMSALMLHRDYRDWFEADGAKAWIGVYPSPFLSASFGVVTQRERSLPVETDWSIFRQTARFRPNPQITEGTYRAYTASLRYETLPERRSHRNGLEHDHRLAWSRSDESLDSDFDSWLAVLDSRTYLRLSPDQSMAFRVVGGVGSDRAGTLAPQRRFIIGGLGTLRGQDFQSLSGDRMAMMNVEYEFTLVGASRALVFTDAGAAWDAGSLTDQRIAVDVGAGVRLGESGVSFFLAKNVNRSDSDVKALVRFQDTF